jgi:hypothetical protein
LSAACDEDETHRAPGADVDSRFGANTACRRFREQIKAQQVLNIGYPMRYGLGEQIWPRSHVGVVP